MASVYFRKRKDGRNEKPWIAQIQHSAHFDDELQAREWAAKIESFIYESKLSTKKCEWCKKEFKVLWTQHAKRFCSRECERFNYKPPRIFILKCEWCKNEFETKRKKRFCCLDCNKLSIEARKIKCCRGCKKEFRPTRENRLFCSAICKEKVFKRIRREYYQNRSDSLRALEGALWNLGVISRRKGQRPGHKGQERTKYLLELQQAAKQVGLV